MKMNKKTAIKGTAFFSALLVMGGCFSAQVDKEVISARCERVYNTLDKMFEEHKSTFCAHDAQYAGWVMQGAAALVRSERYSTALKNLKIADATLSRIYFKPQECTYFSPNVKSSLDEVKILINEIENFSN